MLGEVLSVACAFVWALSVVWFKRVGGGLPAWALNSYKNAVALALLVPTVLWFHGPQWPGIGSAELCLLLLSGLIGIGLADSLYFASLKRIGAGQLGVIGNLYSPFVVLLSFWFLEERLGALQWFAFALVMAGVIMVHEPSPGSSGADRRRGMLLGVAAIACNAIAVVMVKRVLEQQPFLWVVSLRLLGGLLGLLVFYGVLRALQGSQTIAWRKQPWLAITGASFLGTYVAMLLWLGGYKYTQASIASVLNESASVFIVVLAWGLLGEAPTMRKLGGVALTMCGVGLLLAAATQA